MQTTLSEPASPALRELFRARIATPEQALARITSGMRVYLGSNCGQPTLLTEALVQGCSHLRDVEIVHLLTSGPAPYVEPPFCEHFRHRALFIGRNVRQASDAGRVDYVPIFLSEIPALFQSEALPLDVAMVSVSPPDKHGYCSLGVSVDIGLAACHAARIVIAEVNPNMPRVLGVGFLHVSEIDLFVPSDRPILEHHDDPIDDVARRIGNHVADLVEDGATLQTGIGAIPGAVLASLGEKNDLGVHTEMFGDALIEPIERGVVTCRRKTLHPYKVVGTFCLGSRRLYDYLHDNPFIEFHPSEYVNDPFVIAQNDKMVAINSAIEVDLTGQVVADMIGPRFYSGIGGQVDFVRGAGRSRGGKPVIALPSTARKGTISRIVSRLTPGAGVVTSRGDVRYVVTEFGTAYLHGKSIPERVEALVAIAHPDWRDRLTVEAREAGLLR
jgi:acetyl-CoA hydrolase